MQCIKAPANKYRTFYEVLFRALKMKAVWKKPAIVCDFEKTIFKTASEIKWCNPSLFKDCILISCKFHAMIIYIPVIAKRFKDARVRDVLVKSVVIAEGSVESALSSKIQGWGVTSLILRNTVFVATIRKMILWILG